jgi:hypothetical protein
MANGVLKVRVGGAWLPVATAAGGPHHATHETGGNDEITSINAGILTSGTVPNGRFPATLPAVSGANLTNLNATNLATGTVSDARLSINVLRVNGGFPGGTANFLRADGTFSPAGTGNVTGPAGGVTDNVVTFADMTGRVLRDSGLAVSNVPRLNTANAFTGALTALTLQATSTGWGSLGLTHSDAGANLKNAQIYYASGNFVIRTLSDAWDTQYGYFVLNQGGGAQVSGNLMANAAVTIGKPGGWPSIQFHDSYLTFNNKNGTQIAYFTEAGGLVLTAPLQFSQTTFNIQNNSGTPVLTIRNDGVVACPYFLVVPVGTDRWAPA